VLIISEKTHLLLLQRDDLTRYGELRIFGAHDELMISRCMVPVT